MTRWRDADMVQRWVSSAWLRTEKHFRKVVGLAISGLSPFLLGRENKPSASSEKVA